MINETGWVYVVAGEPGSFSHPYLPIGKSSVLNGPRDAEA
jgi:hypothetical protein